MSTKTTSIVSRFCFFLFLGLSPAFADYRYVNMYSTNTPVAPYTDYNTPALNIQDAVDVCQSDDVVIVGPGAYFAGQRATPGAAALNRIVVTNAIVIQAYYGPAMTLIIGAGPAGDSAVRCAYLSGGATLSGFTLTNGYTRTSGAALKDCSGGGAYAFGGVLANCIIMGNTAATNGGGVCGGTVMNCAITGNSADLGGGTSGGTVNNCLIAGNTAIEFGGGAYAGTLNNCTICGNTAASGGGTYESGVNNSIVYYNSAGSDTNSYAGSFSHCCVVPDPGGTGNTAAPPQFVAYPTDLHLLLGSPCIDAGDNSYAFGTTDLDGNSRIMNGTVDMGAYEFVYVNVSGRVVLDYSGLEGVTVSDGTRSNLTDAAGSYTIAGVPKGTHTLTARKANYVFQPASLTFTVTSSDISGLNFTAQRFHVMAAINCGGGAYTDLNGIVYAADTNFSGGTVVSTTDPITNTADGALYQNGRESYVYNIPLTNGDYLLTLKFAEIQYTNSNQRVFDVIAGVSPIVYNLDIFSAAGGHDLAYDITKSVTVTDGTLHVSSDSSLGMSLVNAILVVLDESGLVTGPNGTPTWWLRQYGLTNNPIAVDELRDVDGDGMPAWQEYLAGTDPTNYASRFYVPDMSHSVSGRVQITVATVAGKPYRLQVSTNLLTGRWLNYQPTNEINSFIASGSTTMLSLLPSNTFNYYRLKLDIPLSHPLDAVAYGGHFYKVFDDTNSSWHEMKTKCEDAGGYLACIESAGEQNFLATLAGGRYLAVGGTDEYGPWEWINGSPWGYVDWDSGQPNGNLTGVEFYLELYNGGKWNDVADRSSDYSLPPDFPITWMPVGYICEWEH